MIIPITSKHINTGKLKKGKCPLSLAMQDACDLPPTCFIISDLYLELLNFNGSIIYLCKWPTEARRFMFNFMAFARYAGKKPKPIEFEIGTFEYYPGDVADILGHHVRMLNDPDGGFYDAID